MLIFSHLLENCFYLWPCQRRILRKSKVRDYYNLLEIDIPNNMCSFFLISKINYHICIAIKRCLWIIFQFLLILYFYKITLKVHVCLHSWHTWKLINMSLINWFMINFSLLGVVGLSTKWCTHVFCISENVRGLRLIKVLPLWMLWLCIFFHYRTVFHVLLIYFSLYPLECLTLQDKVLIITSKYLHFLLT